MHFGRTGVLWNTAGGAWGTEWERGRRASATALEFLTGVTWTWSVAGDLAGLFGASGFRFWLRLGFRGELLEHGGRAAERDEGPVAIPIDGGTEFEVGLRSQSGFAFPALGDAREATLDLAVQEGTQVGCGGKRRLG